MPEPRAFSYVLPVHNDADVLADNVRVLVERLSKTTAAEIVLVENGSRDRSWDVCASLGGVHDGVHVLPFREDRAGIGFAYARGLRELVARHGAAASRWAVLTGTDLPFAFTDLDRAQARLERGEVRALAGSKGHPESRAWAGARRFAMSVSYRLARRTVLRMKLRDSQGSFLLRLDLVDEVASKVEARDFFFTTELAYLIELAGEEIVEVPVVLEAHQLATGASTVRPLRDASRMLKQLVDLRRRSSKI